MWRVLRELSPHRGQSQGTLTFVLERHYIGSSSHWVGRTLPRMGLKMEVLFRASRRVPGAPYHHWPFCIGDYNGHHPP